MRLFAAPLAAVCAGASLFAAALPAFSAPSAVAGRWDAVIEFGGNKIPFRLDVTGEDGALSATFFDGARPNTPSTAGSLKDGVLTLDFGSYGTTLTATLAGGELDGVYENHRSYKAHVHAVLHHDAPKSAVKAPNIAGEDWVIPLKGDTAEAAWHLTIHQKGGYAEATILRLDGDTGTLNGDYVDGKFVLSHFAGERPALLEITPDGKGRLSLSLADGGDAPEAFTAVREKTAKAENLGLPGDPLHFTGVKDPNVPFAFSFNDLSGKLVSNTDARFRHKVVIVDISGSWCPNCHDEAPFLEYLYEKYRAQGLEVVTLDFETADQLQNPVRLRAFIDRYKISYPVLLAGNRSEQVAKLPQTLNLKFWPTTFFLGRDGKVKVTHVGFTSPGSGATDKKLKIEVEALVKKLLAQKAGG